MNCVSVQQENYKREKEKRSHSAGNNTTSRTFKSCLRGEIEDADSKLKIFQNLCLMIFQYLRHRLEGVPWQIKTGKK